MSARDVAVETPIGEARLVVHDPPDQHTMATLLVTHGAGGGIDAVDVVALAETLPAHGLRVVRVEMPWRVQGKKLAPRPAVIDESYRAVVAGFGPAAPFVIGGRSAGARSACRIGAEVGAAGVLALSFPLHPPGRPEKSRVEELTGAGLPTLVVQGGADAFGRPEEFPANTEMSVVPSADHGMKTPKRSGLGPGDVAGIVVAASLEWIVREIAGTG